MWVTSIDRWVSRLTMEGNCILEFSRFLHVGYDSLHKFSCNDFETNYLELHLQILASLWVSEIHFKIQKRGNWSLFWSVLHSFSSNSRETLLLEFGVAFSHIQNFHSRHFCSALEFSLRNYLNQSNVFRKKTLIIMWKLIKKVTCEMVRSTRKCDTNTLIFILHLIY